MIENLKVYGLKESVIRSGYPMRTGEPLQLTDKYINSTFENVLKRGRQLGKVKTGTGHDNYLKGIIVQFDLKYAQYLTPQLQRYSWIDIISSQSKMHRLTRNKNTSDNCNKWVLPETIAQLDTLIYIHNNHDFTECSYKFGSLEIMTKDEMFLVVLSNCPLGFEMWMGITTNYLQLKTIRQQRRTHDLPEWGRFCAWIDTLPYFQELTNKNFKNEKD